MEESIGMYCHDEGCVTAVFYSWCLVSKMCVWPVVNLFLLYVAGKVYQFFTYILNMDEVHPIGFCRILGSLLLLLG